MCCEHDRKGVQSNSISGLFLFRKKRVSWDHGLTGFRGIQVFCLEHRSYKDHECPESDRMSRKVIVCEACSASIETTGKDREDERLMMERHLKSGSCDPAKKNKPGCPVGQCTETLTFSNTSTCKICQVKVCLRHRFPDDHSCQGRPTTASPSCVAVEREVIGCVVVEREGSGCSWAERRRERLLERRRQRAGSAESSSIC